jgi:hypothetical protein
MALAGLDTRGSDFRAHGRTGGRSRPSWRNVAGRAAFSYDGVGAGDAIYRWNTKLVGNPFCSACGCAVWVDSPAFEPDGSWDGKTRVSINARLLDDFEAADWPVTVIDGKHLW